MPYINFHRVRPSDFSLRTATLELARQALLSSDTAKSLRGTALRRSNLELNVITERVRRLSLQHAIRAFAKEDAPPQKAMSQEAINLGRVAIKNVCVQGQHKLFARRPCEDAVAHRRTDSTLVAVVADGISSCPNTAAKASKFMAELVCEIVTREADAYGTDDTLYAPFFFAKIHAELCRCVYALADELKASVGKVAVELLPTTFQMLVVRPKEIFGGGLGDGWSKSSGVYRPVLKRSAEMSTCLSAEVAPALFYALRAGYGLEGKDEYPALDPSLASDPEQVERHQQLSHLFSEACALHPYYHQAIDALKEGLITLDTDGTSHLDGAGLPAAAEDEIAFPADLLFSGMPSEQLSELITLWNLAAPRAVPADSNELRLPSAPRAFECASSDDGVAVALNVGASLMQKLEIERLSPNIFYRRHAEYLHSNQLKEGYVLEFLDEVLRTIYKRSEHDQELDPRSASSRKAFADLMNVVREKTFEVLSRKYGQKLPRIATATQNDLRPIADDLGIVEVKLY